MQNWSAPYKVERREYNIVGISLTRILSSLAYLFLSLSGSNQMVNTRRNISGSYEDNNNNQNPPPSPPTTLEQQMTMQTQIMQALTQTMVQMLQQQTNHTPQPHQPSRLGEFKRTQPLVFSREVEPMDADDWLKDIERKLQVAQCNDREMVLYASHQLAG